ncbi:MAG: hypothetical protein M4D80_28815 [Myxococcota bacterium]|nr:hypothetical protein [Deltaproteobacteria bacterium]MDQ3339183.1 hypothetical protein [Myxococcota bacterium]
MGVEAVKWLVIIALLGGCYNPAKEGHCSVQCGVGSTGNECPDDMTCGPDLYCHDDNREDCTKSDGGDGGDGGVEPGCWKFWKSMNGPQLGQPQLLLEDPSNLTNPSLTQDGMNMYVSEGVAPNQEMHLSTLSSNNTWSAPVPVASATTLVRIRCTLPSTNAFAICVENNDGTNDNSLLEWKVDALDSFSNPSTTRVASLNLTGGAQGDPDINHDGTQLFFSSASTITRAVLEGGIFAAKPALAGFVTGDRSPTISPNADVMVFTRGGTAAQRLYYGVRRSDTIWTTAALTVLGGAVDLDTDPELSADGCQLLVASRRAGGDNLRNIYAFTITGSR